MSLTLRDIEDGIASKFWKEIGEWLIDSIGLVHMDLEDPDGTLTIEQYKSLSAEAKAYKRVLQYPGVALKELQERKFDASTDD